MYIAKANRLEVQLVETCAKLGRIETLTLFRWGEGADWRVRFSTSWTAPNSHIKGEEFTFCSLEAMHRWLQNATNALEMYNTQKKEEELARVTPL